MADWDACLLPSYHRHTNLAYETEISTSWYQLGSAQEHTQHHETSAAAGVGSSGGAGWMTARK